MYKTTTYFIKAQTPGISMSVLLDLYKQELELQEVSNIEISSNKVIFSNETFKIFWFAHAYRFSNFQSGEINIKETDKEYTVTLSANMSRILNKAGAITAIVILFMFFCGVFNEYSIFFGLFIFLAALGIMYIQTGLFFSVYFNAMRNEMEEVIQNNTLIQ